MRSRLPTKTALMLGLALYGTARADDGRTLMRYPTRHGDDVVFVAHGNLWHVDAKGGTATRLTSDPGQDLMPRYSPDGKWIAYTASIEGNRDVYVIPSGGGTARRMTWHSDIVPNAPTRWGPDNMVDTWTPDSKNIVFLSRRMAWNPSIMRAFSVPLAGGLPTPLALDNAGFMTFGPNGHSIAYTRIFRDFRTWKRYDGGMAQDVYTYDFDTHAFDRITDWKGTDTSPMWDGNTIWFLSDRDKNRRENIWAYDMTTHQFREVTHFADYDVEFPSFGPGGIVFQQGGRLQTVDLPSGTVRAIDVTVPDDGTRTLPRMAKLASAVRDEDNADQTDFALSPNGKRAAFAARGQIMTVPAEHGAIRNLTHTSAGDADHPAWSPDGTRIAYTTDASGAQQIAIRPAQGGPERQVTHFATGYYYRPAFSPDGTKLLFGDGNHGLHVIGTDGSHAVTIATDPYDEIRDAVWSPDAKWVAFSMRRANRTSAIQLYELATGKLTAVSRPFENDHGPAFTEDGKYLAFISARHENPTFSESEMDFATLKTEGVYLAMLSKGTASPFAPRSDEGAVPPPGAKKPDATWHPGASPPIAIDLDGLMDRVVALPIEDASIDVIESRGNRIFYETRPPRTIEGELPGEKSTLHVYDLGDRKDAEVTDAVDHWSISADGTKVLVQDKSDYRVIDAKDDGGHGGGSGEKKLDLSKMTAQIDPRAEWNEMYENAWRLDRDMFFNPKMNGVDWQHVHDQYAKLLPLVGSRDDLNYLIGQIQGELCNSHTYVGGGDDGNPVARAPIALLGVDYALDAASGRYRLARIYRGDQTRAAYRGPLAAPGLDVHDGDFLLAVNGIELKAPTDPTSLFIEPGSPVTLSIAPSATGPRRDIEVDPVKSEKSLREAAWIEDHRRMVDRLSGGRIGYVYLSDMSELGLEQFVRQFYPQIDKQAMVIDDRWNGGGFIDELVLERLRRVLVGMETNREHSVEPLPRSLVNGPKIVLMNHWSASDGDIFPYFFRAYGLGKLVGTRTWGGVRGIRGEWKLVDGGEMTISEFSLYGLKSEWIMENHGVDPDIEVEDTPGELQAGHDRQIEVAVSTLLGQIGQGRALPPPPAPLPAYPPDGMP